MIIPIVHVGGTCNSVGGVRYVILARVWKMAMALSWSVQLAFVSLLCYSPELLAYWMHNASVD